MQITQADIAMKRHISGFTLVELSIVLVILGLLVGGVLAGQSLIRASELRSVTTEFQRYLAATHSFRDKYFAIPGDMAAATSFWGKDNTNCSGHAGTAATPGTCNGDGNGSLSYGAANGTGEMFQFWKQLGLAGLVEGSYSGLSGAGAGQVAVFGTNSPRSKLGRAGWTAYTFSSSGHSYWSTIDYGNYLSVGAQDGSTGYGAIIKPEEAWNIDTKMDDGRPQQGKVMAIGWDTCTTAASATDLAGAYALSTTSVECALVFSKSY